MGSGVLFRLCDLEVVGGGPGGGGGTVMLGPQPVCDAERERAETGVSTALADAARRAPGGIAIGSVSTPPMRAAGIWMQRGSGWAMGAGASVVSRRLSDSEGSPKRRSREAPRAPAPGGGGGKLMALGGDGVGRCELLGGPRTMAMLAGGVSNAVLTGLWLRGGENGGGGSGAAGACVTLVAAPMTGSRRDNFRKGEMEAAIHLATRAGRPGAGTDGFAQGRRRAREPTPAGCRAGWSSAACGSGSGLASRQRWTRPKWPSAACLAAARSLPATLCGGGSASGAGASWDRGRCSWLGDATGRGGVRLPLLVVGESHASR